MFEDLLKQGFVRARVNGEVISLNSIPELDRQMRHDIEVVVDRIEIQPANRSRITEAVELAIKLGKGTLIVADEPAGLGGPSEGPDEEQIRKRRKRSRPTSGEQIFSTQYSCPQCGSSFDPPSPQLFSFNSPRGMCAECDGLGEIFTFDPKLLIPDPSLSLHDGCVELLGKWKDLGRWRRHIFQGVADTIERVRELPTETMLKSAWSNLPESLQRLWLWGTGSQHITLPARRGSADEIRRSV